MITLSLVGLLFAAIVISTVIPDYTDEEVDEMFDEVVEEITTYTQVKDKTGKYSGEYPNETITKVAILITPLVSIQINMSGITTKLDNGEYAKMISYNGDADVMDSGFLFEHPIWNNLTIDEFGFLVINDEDHSITDYDIINKNSDMTYIIFRLQDELAMRFQEEMTVTLFPSTGWQKTIHLEAGLPTSSIVHL